MVETRNQTCCCLPIKACASIIAILCILSEIVSLCFGFINFLWWIAPTSIVFIIFYCLIILGICTERSTLLIPAEIILGIKIIFTFLFSIILFMSSRYVPERIIEKYKNVPMFEEMKNLVQHFFFLFALIIFAYLFFIIYSFFVIRKARKWISVNAKTLTHPITESVAVIVYAHPHHPHQHPQPYYHEFDPPSQQGHVYFVNPNLQRRSISDVSVTAPPGYNDPSWNHGQQTAMSQSQLQRLYYHNPTPPAEEESHPHRTYQNIYPVLPSAPPPTP